MPFCSNCSDTGFAITPEYSILWPKYTSINVQKCYELHANEVAQLVEEGMKHTAVRVAFRGVGIPVINHVKEMAAIPVIKNKQLVTSSTIAAKTTGWLADREVKEMSELLMKLTPKQVNVNCLKNYAQYRLSMANTKTRKTIIDNGYHDLICGFPLLIPECMPDNFVALFHPDCGRITETNSMKFHADASSILFWYTAEFAITNPKRIELLQLV